MNQETIENHIKNLSKTDFDGVARLILDKIFHVFAVDVDGKGDGGSDFRAFNDERGNLTIAIQKTVQGSDWERKVTDDARKAKDELDCKHFYFLTSRARESSALRRLESKISSELGMPATCLGSTEIAGLITEAKLLGDFAHAIGLPLDVNIVHRPDQREILLHSYFALSDDRNDLRSHIYESSLLSQLHLSEKALDRNSLLDKTMVFLALPEHRRSSISGRVDALLSSGKIYSKDGLLYLQPITKENLLIADGIYIKELSYLSAAQIDLLSEYDAHWDQQKSAEASLLLAQAFVERQIKAAKQASLSFVMTGFGSYIENPTEKLKDLIRSSGVNNRDVNTVLKKMVELAQETPLIKKLTSSVTYVALETSDPGKMSALLGYATWKSVRIILDASVAIPYLVSSLFGPSGGRFSQGSNQTVSTFKQLGAVLCMPWHYLNECASHLVNAIEYGRELPEFEDSFKSSQNGYVAHYYQLKSAGVSVPNTFLEYIGAISDAATKRFSDKNDKIRRVMQELQPLFADYGVVSLDIPRLSDRDLKEVQIEYVYSLRHLSRKKTENLINHDVSVLSHMLRTYTDHSERMICLTWDGVMMDVGRKLSSLGWVVSPVEAADLVQSKLRLSEGKLMALAHSIARTMEVPAEIGGRIVDRAIMLSGEKLADWEYRKKIKEFRDRAMERLDPNATSYNLDQFDQETDSFLREQGIAVPDNAIVPNEGEEAEIE